MIAFFLALQVAAGRPIEPIPDFIFVRDGATRSSVPVTINGGEASVRADALMRAMKGTLVSGTNLHYTLALPRVRLDLIDGIPFAKRDTLTIPLTRAPQVRGGQLYLPFQFVSEVIPRYGGGYSYDVAQTELRAFGQRPENIPATKAAASSTTAVARNARPVQAESVRPASPPPRDTVATKP